MKCLQKFSLKVENIRKALDAKSRLYVDGSMFSNQTFAENSPLLKGPGCFLLMASHKLSNVVQYLLALNVHPGLGCPPATCPASPEI
jgi:hypothetical protein